MCLQVHANGYGDGEDTHLSVFAALMSGEHDEHLEWPFEGDVIVELLNWKDNTSHTEHLIDFSGGNSRFSSVRVTNKDIGDGWGAHQFISHSSLSYNSTTNTEYLQDDCLRLKVKKVAVYSTILLHKTLSWQDPSQSVCEFTVTEFSKRRQFDNNYYSPPFYTPSWV